MSKENRRVFDNSFLVAMLLALCVGCFGGDKMSRVEMECRRVTVAVEGDRQFVRLIHRGEWTFAEGWVKNGRWDGKKAYYRPDGILFKTETYKDGRIAGEGALYYPDGRVASRGIFTQRPDDIGNDRTNMEYFDPEGNPVSGEQFMREYYPKLNQWFRDL